MGNMCCRRVGYSPNGDVLEQGRCPSHQPSEVQKSSPAMFQCAGDDCAINELLEGRMDLDVILPDGRRVRLTVERRTPMMDLLVQAASATKISPAGHTLHVFENDPLGLPSPLPYKPSTPIGSLDANTVCIVPKKEAQDSAYKKMGTHRPFEPTFRVQVHLPRNQLTVVRVSPRMRVAELRSVVCAEKSLDAGRYQLVRPTDLGTPLVGDMTLAEYGATEITLLSNSSIESHICNSTSHIIPYAKRTEGQPKKTGILRLLAEDAAYKDRKKTANDTSLVKSHTAPNTKVPERQKPKKRRPAPPPPDPSLHSRQSSSDSSGYHEASTSVRVEPCATDEKASSDSSGVSSLPPSVALFKKRRAPAPPPAETPLPLDGRESEADLVAEEKLANDTQPTAEEAVEKTGIAISTESLNGIEELECDVESVEASEKDTELPFQEPAIKDESLGRSALVAARLHHDEKKRQITSDLQEAFEQLDSNPQPSLLSIRQKEPSHLLTPSSQEHSIPTHSLGTIDSKLAVGINASRPVTPSDGSGCVVPTLKKDLITSSKDFSALVSTHQQDAACPQILNKIQKLDTVVPIKQEHDRSHRKNEDRVSVSLESIRKKDPPPPVNFKDTYTSDTALSIAENGLPVKCVDADRKDNLPSITKKYNLHPVKYSDTDNSQLKPSTLQNSSDSLDSGVSLPQKDILCPSVSFEDSSEDSRSEVFPPPPSEFSEGAVIHREALKRSSSLLSVSSPPPIQRRSPAHPLQRSLSDLSAECKGEFEAEQERLKQEYIKLQRQFVLWQQQILTNHAMLREECLVSPYARTFRQSHSLPDGDDVPCPKVSRSLSYEPSSTLLDLEGYDGVSTLRSSKTKNYFKPPQVKLTTKNRQRLPPEIITDKDVDFTTEIKHLTSSLPSSENLKISSEHIHVKENNKKIPPPVPTKSASFRQANGQAPVLKTNICQSNGHSKTSMSLVSPVTNGHCNSIEVQNKVNGHSKPVDSRQGLMNEIRQFGGRTGLRKISSDDFS